MNKEEYIKLRFLPENKDLSEYDFQMKYSNLDKGFNYLESSKINNINDFKENMLKMRQKVDKRVVEC